MEVVALQRGLSEDVAGREFKTLKEAKDFVQDKVRREI